ncbi:MAG: type II secretion system GspH family protein [Deltaproteobacteria bacterium]|nr:type II secretion system GspH family protein [Deltaproteobacteria bacterium]
MIKKISKKFKKVNSQKGFTLLEILVVLTIMGFLIAMVAPRLAGISGSAVDTVCDSNQNRMLTYMSTYYEQTNRYPSKLTNLVVEDITAGTYQIAPVSNQDPDDGVEVLPAEFNDRNHFHIHHLDAAEADELKNMGIVKLFNLNNYSGIDNAIADTTNDVLMVAVADADKGDSMVEETPSAGVGVAMIGCGKTVGNVWVATNVTERGWGEPDWFGRIILGMGPECSLITSGVISNAAHCPGGIQNADNATYNDYNLVLPRLEATVTRMTDVADPLSGVITDNDALEDGLQVTALAYDEEPVDPYIIANNDDNLRQRSFTLDEAQERWQFATQCPEGHMYPEDDGEFWGINIDGNVNIDS